MSRLKNMPRFAWLVIGVCITALVLPTAAYASGGLTFTGIKGTSGNKADVTAGTQLLTAEAAPSAFQDYAALDKGSGCYVLTTVAAGQGFIAKNLVVSPDFTGSPQGGSEMVRYFTGSTCTGTQFGTFWVVAASGSSNYTAPQTLPLDPGFAVATGDSVSVQVVQVSSSSLGLDFYLQGYTVPSADVATSTP